MAVRWYVAYALSYRDIEELMRERGVPVDHGTIQRGFVAKIFYNTKSPVFWIS